jgi:putative tryptophan/tyrosine transport system substrate-binding protein
MITFMHRRSFLTLLGTSAAAWPLVAGAQQQAMPVVGLVNANSMQALAPYVDIFRKTLAEAGYFEGRNIAIEYRWADGHAERIPALVSDLVRRRVSLIYTGGAVGVALAAKAATSTIPIVFNIGGDPVAEGLVPSLNRPGGNLTGFTLISYDVRQKQVELLRKLMPSAKAFGHLVNSENSTTPGSVADVEAAARKLDWPVKTFNATNAHDFDKLFADMAAQQISALVVQDNNLFNSNAQHLSLLAARHRIAALYVFRDHPQAGSLISYGPSRPEAWRQCSLYVVRILKGEKPADLPVQQATRFELVINLKTARIIGLDIPTEILTLADEVIE